MPYTLEADSIQLSYGHQRILGDIYLKCEVGKIVGLLGRNGSGKSSLLKVIFGVQPADSKSIRVDGLYCPKPYQVEGLVFYVPQGAFLPNLSTSRLFRIHKVDFDVFMGYFPDYVLLKNRKMNELSTGKRRIIEIYLGIMSRTKFTLIDEPFAALDPRNMEKIASLMLSQSDCKGFLITDHRWEDVWEMSDALYFLKGGKTYPRQEEQNLDMWKDFLAI